jgi:CRISPR-associated protein (TIGR02710 family)
MNKKIIEQALFSDDPVFDIKKLLQDKNLITIIPELEVTVNFDQKSPYHKDVLLDHILEVVKHTPSDPVLRWAALLHDIGKPETFSVDERGIGHFYGHHKVSAEKARVILSRLGYSEGFIDKVYWLIYFHMNRLTVPSEKGLSKLYSHLGSVGLKKLLNLFYADQASRGISRTFLLEIIKEKTEKYILRMEEQEKMNDLEQRLAELSTEWIAMIKQKQIRIETDKYYTDKVFPLVKEVFKNNEQKKIRNEQVYGLILTLGTSPEPLILSISTINPQKILFLFTDNTENLIDTIVEQTGITNSQWSKRKVTTTNLPVLYKACKDIWKEWGTDKTIYADLTGGTKAMAAGLMAAGALLNFTMLTVSSDNYIKEQGKPYPGSEYIEILENPYEVLGELKSREAFTHYNNNDYKSAAEIFDSLRKITEDTRQWDCYYYLSKTYEHIDTLNLKYAMESLNCILEFSNRYQKYICQYVPEQLKMINEMSKRLELLSQYMSEKKDMPITKILNDKEAVLDLIIILQGQAQRRMKQGKWDMACFFLYRVLEIISQRRLFLYGLQGFDPDYHSLENCSYDEVQDKFNQTKKDLIYRKKNYYLPDKIAITDGYLLLEVLQDECRLLNMDQGRKNWEHFKTFIDKRNNSILAHGYQYISEKDYMFAEKFTNDIVRIFSETEGMDYEGCKKIWEFIKI